MEQVVCNLCNTKITYRKDLIKHQKTKKCQEMNQLVILKNSIYTNQIIEYKNEITKLNEINIELKVQLEDKDKQIKLLQEKSEEYRKIVEKAATKSTVNNYSNNNNNYLNYISSEPLRLNEVKEQARKYINSVSVMYDDYEFHDHIVENILKDKNGKDKVLCTDINRKNFTYKDENSGKMIYDPELEKLRDQLKKGTDIKDIRGKLLDKLVTEYEENGCTGTDPYTRFADMIKKLNFGNPFVDHVAKKTYVKTKNSQDTTETINNMLTDNHIENHQENIENCEIIDTQDIDYLEYKKLLEEFGKEIK
uniref:Uncharacterized protein n=1 Tax=viral metagenome TaxID=1070528 RepID=A0A6C0I6U1_9ZZZZ